MRIFKDTGYAGNINYVDKNGFAVGWGGEGGCCSWGGEFFSRTCAVDAEQVTDVSLEKYSFNPDFFKELEEPVEAGSSGHEAGGARAFELVHDDDPLDRLYLIVYNWHNGYYSTSLKVEQNATIVREEVL